jgi:hypothetical protein
MNTKIIVTYFCFLGFLALGSSSSFAACPDTISDCNLPGVSTAGYPNFQQGADIKVKNNKQGEMQKLKATYMKSSVSLLSFDLNDTFDISKTSLKLKAKVKKNGLVKGHVKIQGKIADLDINNKKPLMKAKLSGEWDVSGDGLLIGFNTKDIVCHDKINAYAQCTSAESVYLALADAIDSKKHLKTTGTAVTTVPVPAAVWLFASGLLGLAGMARRRRMV